MNFDKVVISSNEDPRYIEFWPWIASAWQRMFGVPVHLAFLTQRDEDDDYVQYLRAFGRVDLFRPVPGIPEANLAKVIRFMLAARQPPNEVVYINDVDLLPLNRQYFLNLTSDRPPGYLLCVGAEIYRGGPDDGKFPAGNLTAEAAVFKALFNPLDLDDERLASSWIGLRKFDSKEDISSTIPNEDPNTFSDESLIRCLLSDQRVPCWHKPRGWSPYTERAICRSDWRINNDRLKTGYYVEAHLLRPYTQHRARIQPILDYALNRAEHHEMADRSI
jgi:hypothetical protein